MQSQRSDSQVSEGWIRGGRILRGGLSGIALLMTGFLALVALTLICCGGPPIGERLGSPVVWCSLLSFPVAIAALPAISRRLRSSPKRWMLAPLLMPAAIDTVLLGMLIPAVGAWFAVAPIALGTCVVYVALRVLPESR